MPPNSSVVTGVCALVPIPTHSPRHSDQGLLMMQRVGNVGLSANGYGTWSIPGGWLEHGESPEEAAVRECAEETGVLVRPENREGYLINPSENGNLTIVTLFVRCSYVSGEPTVLEPEKCANVCWMTFPEIRMKELFAPFRDFLLDPPGYRKNIPLLQPGWL